MTLIPTGHARHQPSNSNGLPLGEIMMVMLVIIVLLIAVVSFQKARQTIGNSKFTTALYRAATIFEQYPILNGSFPLMTTPGVVPSGMEDLLIKVAWTNNTPLGGQWDWITNAPGLGRGIRIYKPTVSEQRMKKIDDNIDDGNLHSGKFQILEDHSGYLYTIE
ncbi:MAG: hypothetical protein KKG09_08375 [Verrucomicrobia bacterium]|nr:hypothetical protein [Verrucomicrobiota bacterium]MCG2679097.1 hypothetical protein [Kiritimatiellia bacterium]MBU4248431.1 hypothetical protein [Verrucomicrobiota bacterium]MBU4290919.1 hypothetical protein [Verrucomicrobiota bacterium]MBU4428040.1 hypothetical protein [Verrucomicrobiota bacterium]